MRPTRLELQGFASFRDHTVVDFTDVELFVLSGPTGAGKSSVIDAMTFALYGSVARYGTRLVEPVISQGHADARVLLEFTADGRRYRVARRVQRTSDGGATTKEARLERLPDAEGADPIDLASGAREVTAEVEAVLGLTFDHFCRTIVLPQGTFQEFLHATPGERQDLLVRLLDLGVYRDVAKRARRRAEEATAQVAAHQPRLEKLAGVTDAAIATAAERVATLDQVAAVVEDAAPELEEIRDRGAEARAAQTRARADLDRLASVAAPEGLADLADRLQAADGAVATATTTLEEATTAREQAEDRAAGATPVTELTSLLEQRAALPALRTDRDAAVTAHEQAQEAAVAARKSAGEATSGHAELREAVRALEVRHGAHALREHLVTGEPCPVCDQPVEVLPSTADVDDLAERRRQRDAAEQAAQQADRRAQQAEIAAATAGEKAQAAAARVQEATSRLAARGDELGIPADVSDEQLQERVREARERDQHLDQLRRAEREARAAVQATRKARTELDGVRTEAMDALRQAQAAVADLGAPPATDDLAASWTALVGWADRERPRRQAAVEDADRRIREVSEQWTARNQVVLDACTRAGVTVPAGGQPATAVASARAEATTQLERLREQQQEAAELRQQIDRLRTDASVATMLGQLLNAKNFEQWLLARGLTRLVVGASSILGDLSQGAYALALGDDNAFLVVDHRNAGEVRHARSLSGGETFLASLALALSLAEHVTDLAAEGSARLESLFLDEGFGTLDADTLDVVAASIEELGSTGRMVGVITHVRDLAERVPTRFEVRRGPAGSTVDRIDA